MPTYAVLGATGATGQALLHLLLQSPKNVVNAYARSKSKLLKLLPQYTDSTNLELFEGSITDVDLLADCLSDVSAVFSVIGANENLPGLHVAQDAAHSIVAACCHLRARNPKVRLFPFRPLLGPCAMDLTRLVQERSLNLTLTRDWTC